MTLAPAEAISQKPHQCLPIWSYRPLRSACAAELGTVQGRRVALPVHFHDEDQWVYVVSGRRRFVIGQATHVIGEGQWFRIPAGTLHSSLTEEVDVFCINLYLSPDSRAVEKLACCLAQAWPSGPWESAVAAMQRQNDLASQPHLCGPAHPAQSLTFPDTIGATARAAGISREHYSRTFRKTYGITAEHYRMLLRVNHARQCIRNGASLAHTAAEAGFADQSHLGRMFKKFFGVTPGRYRQR